MPLFSGRDPLARLIRRSVAGDRAAFTELYRTLHPLVARFVARRVESRADAEELVAEVFRRLVEHLGSFDPDRGSAHAWALRIARNAVIDHYRTHKRAVSLDTVADGLCERTGPLEWVLVDEQVERMQQLVAECSLETRRLLSLRYGDGLRHKEIGELMGLSEATVRKRLSRAVRELRQRASALADAEPEVSHV